ncbi:MAG TPA: YjgN family protein [Gemmatimonadaceae bacterium]|nr:YjgN family protein [Gemmatimonadaceae bacterium]
MEAAISLQPEAVSTRPNTSRFRYHGTGGSFFGLILGNALLTIVTLGIYSFWAKTRVRRFHYSHTDLFGERFAYHGTGGELFSGYLKAVLLLIVLAIALVVVSSLVVGPSPSSGSLMEIGVVLVFYILIFLLMAVAVNGARRYRLSRSSWRGIRFSFHGDKGDFVALMLRGTLLTIVTLGFYLPYFQNQRRAFFVNNARFGSEPFTYQADARELFREYVKAVLLTVPTLALYWIWYSAFKARFFWMHTAIGTARFRSTVSGGELFSLSLTNVLLVIFTLGLGAPWAITRTHAFWCDKVSLRGDVDWASIQQRAHDADATAEGMSDAFDVDVGIGM